MRNITPNNVVKPPAITWLPFVSFADIALLIILNLAGVGCSSSTPTATLPPTLSATDTPIPTSTSTVTPTATATLTPTITGGGQGLLAFATSPTPQGTNSFYFLDMQSGELKKIELPSPDLIGLGGMAWSPDGSKIAFAVGNQERDIYVANADGSGLTNLTSTSGVSEVDPVWSPDGTQINFASGGLRYVMQSDGSSGRSQWKDVFCVDLSPDWQKCMHVLENRDPQTKHWKVSVTEIDDPSVEYVIADLGEQGYWIVPRWSPDSSMIAISLRTDTEGQNIYHIRYDGSETVRVTERDGWDTDPCWSPDSTLIVFQENPESSQHGTTLHIVNKDGTNQKLLIETPEMESIISCAWRP